MGLDVCRYLTLLKSHDMVDDRLNVWTAKSGRPPSQELLEGQASKPRFRPSQNKPLHCQSWIFSTLCNGEFSCIRWGCGNREASRGQDIALAPVRLLDLRVKWTAQCGRGVNRLKGAVLGLRTEEEDNRHPEQVQTRKRGYVRFAREPNMIGLTRTVHPTPIAQPVIPNPLR